MGKGADLVYNVFTAIMLILTIGLIAFVIIQLSQPAPLKQVTLPTVVPTFPPTATFTPSATATASQPPTWTATMTETLTPSPTETLTPSITPTATITDTPAPTLTASITSTPPNSPTPLPSASPTGPTPTPTVTTSPYPYGLREDVAFRANFSNSLACSWQGLGGVVLDINGQPVPNGNFQVHVFNNEIDRIAGAGSNSLYGASSGWEINVDIAANNKLYFVQLETKNGTAISPTYQVQFPGNCESNVAIINFIQTRLIQS